MAELKGRLLKTHKVHRQSDSEQLARAAKYLQTAHNRVPQAGRDPPALSTSMWRSE